MNKSRPFTIEIVFTWTCNYDCPYCYLRPDRLCYKNNNVIREEKINDLIKFIKILDSFLKNRKIIIDISGGEPMLVSNLIKKFINGLNKANIRNLYAFRILTNNTFVDEELLDILKNTNKKLFLQISLHFENFKNKLFWKNLEIYLKYISIFNTFFIYVVDKHNLSKFYENAMQFLNMLEDFLKERYPKEVVKKYFSELTAYFKPRPDYFRFIEFKKEEIDSFFEQYFKLFKYWGEKYNTILVVKINLYKLFNNSNNRKSSHYYCPIYGMVDYLRVYPNLYLGKCGFLPFYFIENTQYFRKYTIYDVIKNPNIIKENFLTKKGKTFAFLNGKILYKFLKLQSSPIIVGHCPIKSLFYKWDQNKKLEITLHNLEDSVYRIIKTYMYLERGKSLESL